MKRTYVYRCSECCDCPCRSGTLVQRDTALKQWRQAKRRRPNDFVAPPTQVPHDQIQQETINEEPIVLPHFPSTKTVDRIARPAGSSHGNVFTEDVSDFNEDTFKVCSGKLPELNAGASIEALAPSKNNGSREEAISPLLESEICSPSCEKSVPRTIDGEEWDDINSPEGSYSAASLPLEKDTGKFKVFMTEHAKLIGLQAKHAGATEAFMDDLLNDTQRELYKSWKGVKRALIDRSGLQFSEHMYCSAGHQALRRKWDGTVKPCDHTGCTSRPAKYTYIYLWNRLEAWLQDPATGPMMFDKFRKNYRTSSSLGRLHSFQDFYSGKIFREAFDELGGCEEIDNSIFLSLTTDGVRAFESVQYSYWPVLVHVLNLPPAERFKQRNIIPVALIPGPNAPVDLLSFLDPLFSELEELRKGKVTRI